MMTVILDFTATLQDAASSVSLNDVLRYFGIICMCFMPLMFLVNQYYLWKEKRERLGSAGPQPPAPAEKKEEKTGDEGADGTSGPEPADEKEEKEEVDDEAAYDGVSTLTLRVGDRYRCILTEQEHRSHTGGRGEDLCWKVTDPFVAEVSPNTGLLTARKCGTAVIEFNNAEIYRLTVLPTSAPWPFEKDWELLSSAARFKDADPQVRLRSVFVGAAADDEVWTFRSGDVVARYAYDREESLCAISYTFPKAKDILAGIEERFSRLLPEKDDNGCEYWYRMGVDPETETYCVTFVLFVRVRDGKTILGMGRVWREGCAEDEIRENVKMIRRSLERVLDGEDVPDIVGEGLKEPRRSRRKAKPRRAFVIPEPTEEKAPEEEPEEEPAGEGDNGGDAAPDGAAGEEEGMDGATGADETASAEMDEDEMPDPNGDDGDDEGGEEGFEDYEREYE